MTERAKAVAAVGAVAAFWLAVWIFAAALVAQPLILPGPGAVALALLRLVCDGGTWAILAGSGARILGGLALAAVCGGVLAGISSRSRAFARLVAPALSFVKATPVACVVVLLLIWLGSARVSIAAVFLMALPGVYFSLVEGLAQVNKPLEQMFRLHGVRGWRLFCAHTWREVLPFVLSCAQAVIGMSWKAGVAAELIGMAVGTVGECIYQAKLLIETADLLAWTVLVVAASWTCERVLVWLLRASGPVAWRAAVRSHGRGLHGRAGAADVAELALAVGDRAPWAPALDGLVLNVPAGGRACVMGASGAGKTTLLALAAGECAPCSMMFQDARLVEDASALDNVLVCADARVDASSAAALLRLLVPGIDVHACTAELSGGQRRRVEIARALLCPGGAVILDEPFTGLDVAARDATAEVVLDLLDGRTLLFATHDASDAQALDISDIITL
ncbi:ATP-binding cassette domain-containing protein [Collinsella sp. AF04-24]|uniref:ATP-binding cassette domain-containing protein n=2 Tax=Coriobacteriaceae TaxID=84107 RepID=UPI000E46AE60|nr:ATP-binding cassette domain-containing protein [Collinsella sp. AM40-7AC]RGX15128.1 ATP-binding cassette domain-containing protein [Collinsella sp. AF04-24]RGY34869.1 ATP-binding cassette domain-containing protein [Collinsella sp. OF02-10]RHB20190.1 ATP-binding cassette domain-containing protein [Collinsella sp. AM40-7AC]